MSSSSSDSDRTLVEPYSSVSELAAELGVADPEKLFDTRLELPEWLVAAEENDLVFHDPGAIPDPKFPFLTEAAFWCKVTSAEALRASFDATKPATKAQLATLPLYVFVLHTTPLRNAQRISRLHVDDVKARVVRFLNYGAMIDKCYSGNIAASLIRDMDVTRETVGVNRGSLSRAMESRRKHEEEMEWERQAAKEEYEATKSPRAHFKLLAATARLQVASAAVKHIQDAIASLDSLSESLAAKAAALEEAMKPFTFMGCAAAPDAAGGAGAPAAGGGVAAAAGHVSSDQQQEGEGAAAEQ